MKSDIFNDKEIRYIKVLSLKQPVLQKVYFYGCALLVPIAFFIYGFAQDDTFAMLIGFLALVVFVNWFLSQSFTGEKILNTIGVKILGDLEGKSSK